MIRIDGSTGEGGGQILRTSLALSVITGRELEIYNIRAGRPRPGLMMQHLTAVRALAKICSAEAEGAEPGSRRLVFRPGAVKAGDYIFDVAEERGSAGSTGLVLQALLPALLMAGGESRLTLKGGTHTKWSPPTTYIEEVFAPALSLMGGRASLETSKYGWYPRGGGEVQATVHGALPLKAVAFARRGELLGACCRSLVSNLPFHIARRQSKQAGERMRAAGFEMESDEREVPSIAQGSFLMLWFRFRNGVAGFTALGERGKRAERVADEACDEALEFLRSEAAIDLHLADQLLIYMALAEGESVFTTVRRTAHLTTNIWTIEQFLPVKFHVEETGESGIRVSVRGVALKSPTA